MIEPLYGNSASYGIRELIQNATDACKTRLALHCEENYKPEVNIIIENREEGKTQRCLRITDNGIGMNLDVIKNHFLNIGSKFRDSNEWKNLNGDKQIQNEPVEKNGKFGVGILSSYLLGDNLKVRTCNVTENIEYNFETKRDTQLIEISKKRKNDGYGTTIEIDLKDDIDIAGLVIGKWYVANDVSINILICDEKLEKERLIDLNEEKGNRTEKTMSDLVKIWNKLMLTKNDMEVYWTYDYKIPEMNLKGKNDKSVTIYRPNLVCNGIVIPKRYDEKIRNSIVNVWPTIYIVDKKGEVELNLSRDEVNGNLPFMEELEEVLLENFMEQYRDCAKKNAFFMSDKMVLSQFNIENYYSQKIMFGRRGYALFNSFFIQRLKMELMKEEKQDIKVVRIWTNRNLNIKRNKMLDDNIYYIFEGIGSHPSLKYRITNYLKDVPFGAAIIYMQRQQLTDYQCYAANAYKLSQKFIDSSTIKCFEDHNDFCKEILKLDLNQEDISLAIIYSSNKFYNYNDGSEILGKYYEEGENVLQQYMEMESYQ